MGCLSHVTLNRRTRATVRNWPCYRLRTRGSGNILPMCGRPWDRLMTLLKARPPGTARMVGEDHGKLRREASEGELMAAVDGVG